MARLFLALILAATAAFTLLIGAQSAPVEDDPDLFRVMTMNIQMGGDSEDRYDLSRVVETIADVSPDLVGLQEVVRNHLEFNCDDQAALIAEGLRSRTRRPWQHVYRKEWNTPRRECLESGRGDEWETEGLVFLSPASFLDVAHVKLPHGRIGLMTRVASAPEIPVIVTHLASSITNRQQRIRQLDALLPWADAFNPGVFMGDLNAEPDAPELTPVRSRYRDAWAEASRRGLAHGVPSGSTRPNRESRIDYVMYSAAAGLTLQSVEVVDTSSILRRTEASDHRPVVATFRRDTADQ